MKKFFISMLIAIMFISIISPANNAWAFEEEVQTEEVQPTAQPGESVEPRALPLLAGVIIGLAVRKGAQVAINKYGKQAVDEALSYSYKSYSGLRTKIGSAGTNREWHHIVEQNQEKNSGLSPYLIQSSKNLIDLDIATHRVITEVYRKPHPEFPPYTSVREAMKGRSFEEQYKVGISLLKEIGVEIKGFY